MARNISEQILEWKERRGPDRLVAELVSQLEALHSTWEARKQELAEFSDYIPLRCVTIIEVSAREAIRELIDWGSPFLDRSESLFKNARIDFVIATNLQGKKLSIGDMAAHSVSTSSVESIFSTFEKLIPSFPDGLRSSHSRWIETEPDWPLEPIIKNFDLTMERLSRLLRARHILAHEIPLEAPYSTEELTGFLEASLEFVSALDWLIVKETKGSIPRTQTAMNILAGNVLSGTEAQLEQLYREVLESSEADSNLLENAQRAWLEHAESEAKLRAALVDGGSMYPMIYSETKLEMVRQRIQDLQWWLTRQEGEL